MTQPFISISTPIHFSSDTAVHFNFDPHEAVLPSLEAVLPSQEAALPSQEAVLPSQEAVVIFQ